MYIPLLPLPSTSLRLEPHLIFFFFASLKLNFIASSKEQVHVVEDIPFKLSVLPASLPHQGRLMSSSMPTLLFIGTFSSSFFKALYCLTMSLAATQMVYFSSSPCHFFLMVVVLILEDVPYLVFQMISYKVGGGGGLITCL